MKFGQKWANFGKMDLIGQNFYKIDEIWAKMDEFYTFVVKSHATEIFFNIWYIMKISVKMLKKALNGPKDISNRNLN